MPAPHLALVLLICLAWGGNFLASAAALLELPPFLYTAFRLALLALVLWPWLKLPAGGQWGRLTAVAICNGVLHFGLSFWALQLAGDLASPAILMQSYIPMATLLAVWFLGERIRWRTTTGIAVSFVGVLVLGFDPIVMDSPQAVVLMLVSAFFLAVGTVLMRDLRGLTPMAAQGWTAVIGVLPLLLLSALLEGGQVAAVREASWIAWGGVVYSALVASVLGHGLFYWLVQRHPVSLVTPYLLIAPVVAVLLGILFWGDRPGPRLWIGGAMVLGGVLVVAIRARARRVPPPTPAEV